MVGVALFLQSKDFASFIAATGDGQSKAGLCEDIKPLPETSGLVRMPVPIQNTYAIEP
jgi:hypothetical protein